MAGGGLEYDRVDKSSSHIAFLRILVFAGAAVSLFWRANVF